MKSYISLVLLGVLSLYAVFGCEGEAQKATTENTSKAQSLMIDDFEKEQSTRGYQPYMPGDVVLEQEGYGIYHRGKANVRLSRVPVNKTDDKALRIEFGLDPISWYHRWVSIRRELTAPLDLREYDGLEFNLLVEVPSNTTLRFTLSDVERLADAKKHGADEMWWIDVDPDVLKNTKQEWRTIRAPFREFYLSEGFGTRHNNGKKDLSRIVAFEMNIISAGDQQKKGVILINSLRAYKD